MAVRAPLVFSSVGPGRPAPIIYKRFYYILTSFQTARKRMQLLSQIRTNNYVTLC